MGNEEGNCNPLQCKESEKECILNHFALHLKQNIGNQLYFNNFFFF